jgi:hypothetical protein
MNQLFIIKAFCALLLNKEMYQYGELLKEYNHSKPSRHIITSTIKVVLIVLIDILNQHFLLLRDHCFSLLLRRLSLPLRLLLLLLFEVVARILLLLE